MAGAVNAINRGSIRFEGQRRRQYDKNLEAETACARVIAEHSGTLRNIPDGPKTAPITRKQRFLVVPPSSAMFRFRSDTPKSRPARKAAIRIIRIRRTCDSST